MIVFALLLNLCDTGTIKCREVEVDTFASERMCHAVGHTYTQDETVIAYRCIVRMRK